MTKAPLFCSGCGESIPQASKFCSKCGTRNSTLEPEVKEYQPVIPAPEIREYGPAPKSRIAAGLLGILLGGIGVHKFYLNKVGLGVVYVLFCWTFIPALIGLIEGIIYLTQDDVTFGRQQMVAVQKSN
jgi:TM2 domain-containing membrane protein YozV